MAVAAAFSALHEALGALLGLAEGSVCALRHYRSDVKLPRRPVSTVEPSALLSPGSSAASVPSQTSPLLEHVKELLDKESAKAAQLTAFPLSDMGESCRSSIDDPFLAQPAQRKHAQVGAGTRFGASEE